MAISSSNGYRCTRSSAGACERFAHGRVIFAGDSAHQVSPFGARGANSGLEDAENIAWKLDFRARRRSAGDHCIDTYDIERIAAADENIGHSTRSTDFIAPHSQHEQRLPQSRAARSRASTISPSAWSMPGGCRRQVFTRRHCRRPMLIYGRPARRRARRCWMRRCRTKVAAMLYFSEVFAQASRLHTHRICQWAAGRMSA